MNDKGKHSERDDYERKSDVVIAKVEQMLKDHIQQTASWQESHTKWCEQEISNLEDKLKPIRSAFYKFETPIRWVGWLVVGTITGSLLWIGDAIAKAIAKHVHGGL